MHTRLPQRLFTLAALVAMLAALAFLPGGRVTAAPVTRYVATTGSDAGPNNCTNAGSPCLTIQHAISQAAPGDTIEVAGGTYVQAANIVVNKSLVLKGANAGVPGTGTRTLPESTLDFNNALELKLLASGVTIDGFKMVNGDEEAIDIDISGGLTDVIIVNNIFENFLFEAVYYSQLAALVNLTIADNKIVDVGQDGYCGISVGTVTSALIARNYIETTDDCGIAVSEGSSVFVIENIIKDVPNQGIYVYEVSDVAIERNTVIEDIGEQAIFLEYPGSGTVVRNNFVASASLEDILIYGPDGVSIEITGNSIAGSSGTGLKVEDVSGTVSVDATCNWWGSADGPTGSGAQGVDDPDSVVTFTPWLTSGTDTDPGTPGFQGGPCATDTTPPVIQFIPEKLLPNGQWVPYGGEWHSGIVRVRVVCTDPGPDASGIVFDYTPARFWFEQDGTFTVPVNAVEGWRCRDAAGNIAASGPSSPIVARVDRRAPVCKVTPSPASFSRNILWQTVNISLSPGAGPSGVDAIWLHAISGKATDRQNWAFGTEDYSGQLKGGGVRQIYTITYAVRDNAGNVGYCSATVKSN